MLFVVNNQQCYATSYCFCLYTVLLVKVYSYFKVEQPPLKEVVCACLVYMLLTIAVMLSAIYTLIKDSAMFQ